MTNSQNQQTRIPAIYLAIHAIQAHLAKVGIAKSHSTNSSKSNKPGSNFQNYNYRSLEDIYNAVTPLLTQHNVICLPNVKSTTFEKIVDNYGKVAHHTHVNVDYKFVSIVDESFVTITMTGEAKDAVDKGNLKAISMAHKCCYTQMFNIPTKGENDTEQQSHGQYYQNNQQNNNHQNMQQQRNWQQNQNRNPNRSVNSVTDEQLSNFIGILQVAGISFERFLKQRQITRDQLTPEMLMEQSNLCYQHIETIEHNKKQKSLI